MTKSPDAPTPALVTARFDEAAVRWREQIEEDWFNALPDNATEAQAVVLAHLLTMIDGYNPIDHVEDWARRRTTGWGTSFSVNVPITAKASADFGIEARHDQHVRQLAILIDDRFPGERSPRKRERESALIGAGWRVLVLSSVEVLSDPEGCHERIGDLITDLVDETLFDAGIMTRPPKPRE